MSKDNGGLLSKVVRFVRHPTVNWSELDHQDTVREDEQSRQRLKEMIERKKRNDFVRGREFDMLPLPGLTHMVPGALETERLWNRIAGYFKKHL